MASLVFELCHKPVIGIALFVLFLCGAPRLFEDIPIDLPVAGATVTREVHASVDMNYGLQMTFKFSSNEARLNDHIVGTAYDKRCMGLLASNFDPVGVERIHAEDIPDRERNGLGRLIPFRVTIRTAKDHSVIVEQTFESLCNSGHNGQNEKYRDIAWIHLPIGDYVVDVTNLQAQPDLLGVRSTLSFHGLQSK